MQERYELNLDRMNFTANEAITVIENAIERKRKEKVKYIVIIHGYGSHGVGGVIRTKARSWLNAQKTNGKIKRVIIGEEFDMYHFQNGSIEMKNNCKALEEYYGKNNMGVTIVEI